MPLGAQPTAKSESRQQGCEKLSLVLVHYPFDLLANSTIPLHFGPQYYKA